MKQSMERIINVISKSLDVLFPTTGGVMGAVSQVQAYHVIYWNEVWKVAIVAAIGAIVGYGIKLLLDVATRKLRNKLKVN